MAKSKTNAELSRDIFAAAKKLTQLLDAKAIEHEKCKVVTPAGEEATSQTLDCFSLGINATDAKWDLIQACRKYTDA